MKILFTTLLLFIIDAHVCFAGQVKNLDLTINSSSTEITGTIIIEGISKETFDTNEDQEELKRNLEISFPNFSTSGNPILKKEGEAPTGEAFSRNKYFYVNIQEISVESQNTALETFKFTYTVSIQSNGSAEGGTVVPLEDLKDSETNTITVKAVFVARDEQGNYGNPISETAAQTKLEKDISRVLQSPNESPSNFKVESKQNRALTLSWDTGSVPHTPTPDGEETLSRQPDNVLAMVFNPNSGVVDLDAYQASATEEQGEQFLCQFSPITVGSEGDCIQCIGAETAGVDVWISPAQGDNPDIHSFSIQKNTKKYNVTNLEEGRVYTVVLQYEKGVKQTKCIQATPIRDFSLSEVNGAEEAKVGDKRCFIVTASFGNSFEKHIDIFRWARDHFLEPFDWGHALVEFYYNHSEPYANAIRDSEPLKWASRTVLLPMAYGLYAIQKIWNEPIYALFFLLGLTLLALTVYRRRWKKM